MRFKSSIPRFAGAAGIGARGWVDETALYAQLSDKVHGPVPVERWEAVRAWLSARADAKHRFGVALRAVPLTADHVDALIGATVPAAMTLPAVRSTPSWRQRAVDAETALADARRRLAQLESPTPLKASGRPGVDWAAAGRKAWETRKRNAGRAA